MAGRKPKPTALKKLQGNPGKRALNKEEPKPKSEIPTCPHYLSFTAKQEWKRLCKELASLGLLTNLDRSMLAAYCQAYSVWKEAAEKISTEGLMIESPSGYEMQSPYVSILNKQVEIMIKLSAEFGMSPASRTKIKVSKPEEVSPFQAFLNKKA